MNALLGILLDVFVLGLSTTITWFCYDEVVPLFSVPPRWEHLTWYQMFCLLWILRVLTGVFRTKTSVSTGVE